MLTLTYEYKLKPTAQQIKGLEHSLKVCRKVWNYALRERKDWIASRKCPINACSRVKEYIMGADTPYPNCQQQCKSLTQAKKSNPELRSVNAQMLQQVLRTLEKAFKDRKERGFGFPRFKKPGRMRSILFPQLGQDPLGDGWVKLPSLGKIRLRQSRPYPDGFGVKQARVLRRASGYCDAVFSGRRLHTGGSSGRQGGGCGRGAGVFSVCLRWMAIRASSLL